MLEFKYIDLTVTISWAFGLTYFVPLNCNSNFTYYYHYIPPTAHTVTYIL